MHSTITLQFLLITNEPTSYRYENLEPYTDTFETSRLKYVVTGPETSLAILLETLSEPRPAQGRRPTAARVAMWRAGGGSWCGELSSYAH